MRNITTIGALVITAALAFGAQNARADGIPGKLLAEGRIDDAIVALQGKINSGADVAESYNMLCRAYYLLEKWDAGISACQKAVQLEPSKSAYHLWLGRLYGGKADHTSFITAASLAGNVRNEFETAVRLDPKSVNARADLADFYIEAPGIVGGGKDKAAVQAREMGKVEPAQELMVTAKIAEKNKDLRAAEAGYRKAIEVSGGQAGPWLALANFYRRNGRYPEMEEAVTHATDPKLDRPDMLVEAAQVLINAGRNFPGAMELLQRYIHSESTVEDAPVFKAHYLLGVVMEKQGNMAGAAEEYRAALSLARDYSLARTALNRVQKGPGRPSNGG
ncbi:MAG: tetratricopeptide repeat protein [Terriglobales bacterium]